MPLASLFYGFWDVGSSFSNDLGGVNLFELTQGPFFAPFYKSTPPPLNMVLDPPLIGLFGHGLVDEN